MASTLLGSTFPPADGQVQVKVHLARSGHAEQAGIQLLQDAGGGLGALGGQAKINGIVDANRLVGQGRLGEKRGPVRTAMGSWP